MNISVFDLAYYIIYIYKLQIMCVCRPGVGPLFKQGRMQPALTGGAGHFSGGIMITERDCIFYVFVLRIFTIPILRLLNDRSVNLARSQTL